jgi:hypothetical protein
MIKTITIDYILKAAIGILSPNQHSGISGIGANATIGKKVFALLGRQANRPILAVLDQRISTTS